MWALTKTATPLLNTPHFEKVFTNPLPLDEWGLLRPVETVAFKGTKVKILKRISRYVVAVETEEYPLSPVYIDSRFLNELPDEPPSRRKKLSSVSETIKALETLVGKPYIWGGNWSRGVEELAAFYPPPATLDKTMKKIWCLEGIDCSGILYEVTDGFVPRNTSDLIHFGKALELEKLSLENLRKELMPLDMVVWIGHMFIVLDHYRSIESKEPFGVIIALLKGRLNHIFSERSLVKEIQNENQFSIRRWHPETLSSSLVDQVGHESGPTTLMTRP